MKKAVLAILAAAIAVAAYFFLSKHEETPVQDEVVSQPAPEPVQETSVEEELNTAVEGVQEEIETAVQTLQEEAESALAEGEAALEGAADTLTQAAQEALDQLTPTTEGEAPEQAETTDSSETAGITAASLLAQIESSDLGPVQKATLKQAVEAASNDPETLQPILDRLNQILGQ